MKAAPEHTRTVCIDNNVYINMLTIEAKQTAAHQVSILLIKGISKCIHYNTTWCIYVKASQSLFLHPLHIGADIDQDALSSALDYNHFKKS